MLRTRVCSSYATPAPCRRASLRHTLACKSSRIQSQLLRRRYATHKDLPDEKPRPRVDHPTVSDQVDHAQLKKLAESITPREAEILRAVNDATYEPKVPIQPIPTESRSLPRLLWEHLRSTKEKTGPQPLGATMDWDKQRRPFDRPLNPTTLLSMAMLLVLWLVYTDDHEAKIIEEFNANPPAERQHKLLEELFYETLGLSQQLRRMGAPQSESLEESGVVAVFVRAVASGDAEACRWGYAGLATFLSNAPEAVPLPRLGKVTKPLIASIMRDVNKEASLQRNIDLNLWSTFLAFAHHYEFARAVPTEVLVYIANRIARLADSTMASPLETEHLELLRKSLVPLSSNERAERFFKSQANETFQREYEAIKKKYPLSYTIDSNRLEYPFVEEAVIAIFASAAWATLWGGRVSPQANTVGLRPLWRLSRPHFSSAVTATMWSATGALSFILARTLNTSWPDKTEMVVKAKMHAQDLPSGDAHRLRMQSAWKSHNLTIGAVVAAVVANLPRAPGVLVGMAGYDLLKSGHHRFFVDRRHYLNSVYDRLDRVKTATKDWAIDKVYGSGPRY